jgi:hypothetical protein
MQHVATLNLTGPRLRACDPCQRDARHQQVLSAKPGTWQAFIDLFDEGAPWGKRVTHLTLVRAGEDLDAPILEEAGLLPVDAGVMGFYDDARLPEVDPETYSAVICSHDNCRRNAFALDDRAVISSAGLGDGLYTLFVRRDAEGDAVAATVRFFDPTHWEG